MARQMAGGATELARLPKVPGFLVLAQGSWSWFLVTELLMEGFLLGPPCTCGTLKGQRFVRDGPKQGQGIHWQGPGQEEGPGERRVQLFRQAGTLFVEVLDLAPRATPVEDGERGGARGGVL